MGDIVKIVAGARIHLGFYNVFNEHQAYGSLGLYVGGIYQGPRISIKAKLVPDTNKFIVKGYPIELAKPVKTIYEKYCGKLDFGVELELLESFERHVGLGSTTQLIMSALYALKKTCNAKKSTVRMAEELGRGQVSGIGVHGFIRGGFLVDAGKPSNKRYRGKVPLLANRLAFPRAIGLTLVIPRTNYRITEVSEPNLWDEFLLERGKKYSSLLAHYAFSYVIPGLVYRDWRLFGKGLDKLQDLTGEFFSVLQGDIYATTQTSLIVSVLRRIGSFGAGQSSWGPLAYGFFPQKQKDAIIDKLYHELDKQGIEAEVHWAEPNNRGAAIIS